MKKPRSNPFGDRLRAAFGGLSNKEIAEKLGTVDSAITNYMNGRIPPGPTLLKIYELTGCSLHWLLTGEGSKDIAREEAEASRLCVELREEERSVVEHLAKQRGLPAPEAARDLLMASVIAASTVVEVEDPNFNRVLVKTATSFIDRNIQRKKGRTQKAAHKLREKG